MVQNPSFFGVVREWPPCNWPAGSVARAHAELLQRRPSCLWRLSFSLRAIAAVTCILNTFGRNWHPLWSYVDPLSVESGAKIDFHPIRAGLRRIFTEATQFSQ
jgi:hypothetical protein